MGVLKVQDPPGSGIWKPITAGMDSTALASVRATDQFVNVTLSGERTLDGVACIDGDRVLLKHQTTVSENDIWIVRTGAWTRDPTVKVRGSTVRAIEGTQNKFKTYTQIDPSTATQVWRVMSQTDYGSAFEYPTPQGEGHMFYNWQDKTLAVYAGGWRNIGFAQVCTSSTRPAPGFDGKMIYESDTGLAFVAQGNVFQPLGGGGGGGAVSPSYADSITPGGDVTVTGTTMTNVGTTITFTSRGPTDVFLASFDVVGLATNGTVTFAQFGLDGAALGGSSYSTHQNTYFTISRTTRITGLAAGNHTLGIRAGNNSAASATLYLSQSQLTIARVAEGAADTTPIGTVQAWGGLSTVLPSGFLLCDGRAVSRASYASLYTAIGTAHGVGDGSTTFNLPNLLGRIPVGLNAADTEFNVVGKTGGEKAHVLTAAEQADMPINDSGGYGQYPSGGGGFGGYIPPNANNTAAGAKFIADGGGGAHNNLQPYSTLCYIIKAFGSPAVVTDTSWQTIPYAANWADTGFGWTLGRYRRQGNKVRVEMMPVRSVSASGASAGICQLPLGFRPTAGYQLLGFFTNQGGTYSQTQVYVSTDGWIYTEKSVAVGASLPIFADFTID